MPLAYVPSDRPNYETIIAMDFNSTEPRWKPKHIWNENELMTRNVHRTLVLMFLFWIQLSTRDFNSRQK